MKLDIDNLTVDQVMNIYEFYGSLKRYIAYPEDGYAPKMTYVERLVRKANHRGGASITEEDLRLANELNRISGILACLELNLFENEEEINETLDKYGLDVSKLFLSDEELESKPKMR